MNRKALGFSLLTIFAALIAVFAAVLIPRKAKEAPYPFLTGKPIYQDEHHSVYMYPASPDFNSAADEFEKKFVGVGYSPRPSRARAGLLTRKVAVARDLTASKGMVSLLPGRSALTPKNSRNPNPT